MRGARTALTLAVESNDLPADRHVAPLPADSPLWDTPRLMITPHCSSDAVEDYSAGTLDLVFENAARLLQGRPLKNRVRPGMGY